jgi:hypothetical protein
MPKANVVFHALYLDPPGAAADDAYLVSKVIFDIELAGRNYSHLFADIRRPMGANVDEESLDVIYDLPFACKTFAAAARTYYRTVLGPHGAMLTPSGPKGLRPQGNVFSTLQMQRVLPLFRSPFQRSTILAPSFRWVGAGTGVPFRVVDCGFCRPRRVV